MILNKELIFMGKYRTVEFGVTQKINSMVKLGLKKLI